MMRRVIPAVFLTMAALADGRSSPDEISFEAGLEFAKPGGDSLQLNLARP